MSEVLSSARYWTVSAFGFVCFVLLLLAVMGTSLGVIVSTFENRRYLAELESLRRDARDMQVLWGQYLVEKSTWADYARIHQIAEQGLGMQRPKTEETVIIRVTP